MKVCGGTAVDDVLRQSRHDGGRVPQDRAGDAAQAEAARHLPAQGQGGQLQVQQGRIGLGQRHSDGARPVAADPHAQGETRKAASGCRRLGVPPGLDDGAVLRPARCARGEQLACGLHDVVPVDEFDPQRDVVGVEGPAHVSGVDAGSGPSAQLHAQPAPVHGQDWPQQFLLGYERGRGDDELVLFKDEVDCVQGIAGGGAQDRRAHTLQDGSHPLDEVEDVVVRGLPATLVEVGGGVAA